MLTSLLFLSIMQYVNEKEPLLKEQKKKKTKRKVPSSTTTRKCKMMAQSETSDASGLD